MAADICFTVLKYSHATGQNADNTIPWTHIAASNLFILVKGKNTDIDNGELTMRVVQGGNVLVELLCTTLREYD